MFFLASDAQARELQKATEDAFGARGNRVLELPAGQGLVIKNRG